LSVPALGRKHGDLRETGSGWEDVLTTRAKFSLNMFDAMLKTLDTLPSLLYNMEDTFY
jgi:hypothetical protein